MNPLAVKRIRADGCDFLKVEGALDIVTAPRMIAVLNESFASLDLPLVVDLSGVDFLDSTGLALLMNARQRLERQGHGFAIVCPDGPIARVFQIADMVGTLRVCRDRRAALRAATHPAGA